MHTWSTFPTDATARSAAAKSVTVEGQIVSEHFAKGGELHDGYCGPGESAGRSPPDCRGCGGLRFAGDAVCPRCGTRR
jgi:hypothetical protein